MRNTLATFVVLFFIFSCNSEKNVPDNFDYGSVNEDTYVNTYFNFKLEFPESWTVLSREQQDRMTGAGIRDHSGSLDRDIIDASLINVASLFNAFKNPFGSTYTFNPSILINAENLKDFPETNDANDYIEKAKDLLKQTSMDFSIVSQNKEIQIDGETFVFFEMLNKAGGQQISQRFFVTIKKGFAINIIISYLQDDDELLLQEMVDNIKFK